MTPECSVILGTKTKQGMLEAQRRDFQHGSILLFAAVVTYQVLMTVSIPPPHASITISTTILLPLHPMKPRQHLWGEVGFYL